MLVPRSGTVRRPRGATIAAVAWLFRIGQPIYHALDSPERYSHIYGPMAFIIPSWSLAVFGAGIRSSKIPGAVSAVAALAVVFTVVYRLAGPRQALFLAGVLAGLCLMFQNYTFWIRPDPIQFLSAAAALFAVVAMPAGDPGLLLGAATGLLIGLKITGDSTRPCVRAPSRKAALPVDSRGRCRGVCCRRCAVRARRPGVVLELHALDPHLRRQRNRARGCD